MIECQDKKQCKEEFILAYGFEGLDSRKSWEDTVVGAGSSEVTSQPHRESRESKQKVC